MAEGYAHIRTAKKSLLLSGVFVIDSAVFSCGAQGPDPLFFKLCFNPKNPFLLPTIARHMHNFHTGRFLCSLVKSADNLIKQSYALGFLSHYATDCNIHPYVEFLTVGDNPLYPMAQGHGFFEAALDSELYNLDYGSRVVNAAVSTPLPNRARLKIVADMLKQSIKEIYGEEIRNAALIKSFKNIRLARRMLVAKSDRKRSFFRFIEKYILRHENLLLSHITPGGILPPLPKEWASPFEKSILQQKDIFEILKSAEKDGAVYMRFAQSYWKGNISLDEFSGVIGSRSYKTNLEVI